MLIIFYTSLVIMKTLLVHVTTADAIDGIISKGEIQPGYKVVAKNTSGRYRYTYLGVLFKYLRLPAVTKSNYNYKDKVYIVFTEDILLTHKPLCWSDLWNFGKCDPKNSIKYDSTKTPAENVEIWSLKYRSEYPSSRVYSPKDGREFGQNEIVFTDSLPIKDAVIFNLNEEGKLKELFEYVKSFGYTVSGGGRTRRR